MMGRILFLLSYRIYLRMEPDSSCCKSQIFAKDTLFQKTIFLLKLTQISIPKRTICGVANFCSKMFSPYIG